MLVKGIARDYYRKSIGQSPRGAVLVEAKQPNGTLSAPRRTPPALKLSLLRKLLILEGFGAFG